MRVGVVGLGAAGLRAMMLLEAAGIECVGFEARERLGGRLRTVELSDGTFYEAGGEWIDSDHERLIALIRELGGEPVVDHQWPGMFAIRGQRYREDDFGAAINADMERVEEEADRLTLDLADEPWENLIYQDLDEKTLSAFLDRHCSTMEGRIALEGQLRSDEGEDTNRVGLLGWLCGRQNYLAREGGEMSSMRFPLGAQKFCEAMAARLRSPLHMGQRLVAVHSEGDAVRLEFDKLEEITVDRVVLAVPVSCLAGIQFLPGISGAKQDAIDEAQMSRTIKIALRFRSKIWEEQGLPMRLMTDGRLHQVWDGSRGKSAVLLAYLGGDGAMELSRLGIDEAADVLLRELEPYLPGAREGFLGAELHDWVADPLAGGGFFSLKPGYVLGHWEALIRNEGRVHFAGDYAAKWSGFIEGALESAERVVEEIKDAAKIH